MGSPGHLDSDARVDGEAMPIDEGVGQSWVHRWMAGVAGTESLVSSGI